ncbi:MAG: cytochrome c [Anaerolineae bacterium]|nr:cytochrome c [Anaerolineae bacterium]
MSSQRSTQTDLGGALVPAIILFGGMTLLLIGLLAARPTVVAPNTVKATSSPAVAAINPTAVVAEATEAVQVAVAPDPAKVKAGENSFQTTCSACHGFNAMGIPGLGKTLIGSKFVNDSTDDQLLAFLQVGRPIGDPLNTTGVAMPARGGNPNFTDDKLVEIIAYIRSLNMAASQNAAGVKPTVVPTSSAPVVTDVPGTFAPLDLSGLAVPTNVSSGDTTTTTEATVEPTSSAPVATSASSDFALPDLSGLPVPTSMANDDTTTTTDSTAEVTVEPTSSTPVATSASSDFSLPDLSGLPVPTSMAKSG